MVDGLINRGDTERSAFLVSCISFLCPFLKKCNLDIEASAEDALSVIGKYEPEILRQAPAVYAHFCELMPEVRHGHYNVKSVNRGFRPTYKEAPYQTAEEYDFVLHEIGKATDSSSLEIRSVLFSHLVQEWPMWDLRMVNSAFDQLYTHHLRSVHESPLLHLDAYSTAFGFTREEFASVRAALFALASFSNGMHLAPAGERDRSGDPGTIARYQSEFLEWNTPILTREFVYSCLTRATGLSGSRVEDVLSFLVLNAVTGDFDNAGDGYLPPLVLFEDKRSIQSPCCANNDTRA
jgi:hypothetical protein